MCFSNVIEENVLANFRVLTNTLETKESRQMFNKNCVL